MMLGKTVSQNSDSGPWAYLVNTIMPQWVGADWGMQLITPPRMEAVTHKLYFEVSNKFGGVSRMYLDSLDIEDNAEDKFKGKMFSLIYWTELSNFRRRKTFDVLEECLRMPHLQPNAHQIICDTNPDDEGEDSWIWKLFYWFRTVDLGNLTDDTKEELNLADVDPTELADAIQGLRELQEQVGVLEFTIDDNAYLTPAQKRAQRSKYAHDKDLLDRYYYGKWVKSAGEGLFSEQWNPSIHIIGESPTPANPNPDILYPDENCSMLLVGWDIGPRNVGVVIMEKVIADVDGKDDQGRIIQIPKPAMNVIDEYVRLGENQPIAVVVRRVLERMRFWEDVLGRKVHWKHWSDRSSFDKYDNIADTYEHMEVFQESNGEIELSAVIKGAGSVDRRIDLTQRLLFENRILVSRKCSAVIEMFSSIKKRKNGRLQATNLYKHAFDAFSYPASMECWGEMQRGGIRTAAPEPSNRFVSTRL